MTPAEEVSRFARERAEADRRYNDALTALDRAIVEAGDRGAAGPDDAAKVATALIVFLQQITAFVESKDREVAAAAGARMVLLERALESVAELRTQMSVVQRALAAMTREPAPARLPAAAPAAELERPDRSGASESSGQLAAAGQDFKYVAFEDQFRGSDEAIAARVRAYVPIFAGGGTVVDLGCGRGELLAALQAAGVHARGVDVNAAMVGIARDRGLDAVQSDGLAFLQTIADGTLGGVVATQVVEHLEPAYLMRLLETASRKLRYGAPIVLETINPACWLAFFSSYIRDITHVRPIHPETLQYLLRANGFERVEIRYSAPVPDAMRMKTIDLRAPVSGSADPVAAALQAMAQTVNANAVILNNLMFTHLDYAAIGHRA